MLYVLALCCILLSVAQSLKTSAHFFYTHPRAMIVAFFVSREMATSLV